MKLVKRFNSVWFIMGCFPTKITPDKQSTESKQHVQHKEKMVIRGDQIQRYEARKLREHKLRQRQIKITSAAEELSYKVMEEREMLSITSKSRATSRTTSRAGSPSLQRKQVTFNTILNSGSPRPEPTTAMTARSEPASEISETLETTKEAPVVSPGGLLSSSRTETGDQGRTLCNGSTVSVTAVAVT